MFLKCRLHYNYFNARRTLLSDTRAFVLFSLYTKSVLVCLKLALEMNKNTSNINLQLPNGLSHPYQLDESVFYLRGVLVFFFFFFFFFLFCFFLLLLLLYFDRNSCEQIVSQKWDSRLIWVKRLYF